jgi:hypothetical protein
MAVQNDEQRKAMFARLREAVHKKGVVRKAVIGGALATAGGIVAYKATNPVLRKRALAAAAAGLALGSGYAGRAYEYGKEQAGKGTRVAGEAGSWMLQHARDIPVEAATAGLIDMPFAMLEHKLARSIDKRVANIEGLAAKRLGEAQQASVGAVSDKVRRLHTKVFHVDRANAEESTRRGRDKALAAFQLNRAKLRRGEDDWNKMMISNFSSAWREGRQWLDPRPEEVMMWLRNSGFEDNEKTRARALQSWRLLQTLGPRAGAGGTII